MRRITTWLLSTVSALVLLFGYHTSTSSTAAGVVALGAASAGSGTSTTSASDATYTGDAVMTRFGAVQVQIAVSGGRITESVVTQVPWSDHKDQEINSYAVPILNEEAVQAQSADVDMVSGATYTSEGYVQSLQSAIDQASL